MIGRGRDGYAWAVPCAIVAVATSASCSLEGLEGPPLASARDAGDATATDAPLGDATPNPARVFVEGQDGIVAIAVNDSNVVWTTATNIRTCASSGCDGAPRELTIPRDLAGSLALQGNDYVYGTGPTSTNGVSRCQVPECIEDADVMYNLGPGVGSVALDGVEVYALRQIQKEVVGCKTKACGGAPDRIAHAPATGGMALGVQRVYWTALAPDNAVYSALRSGAEATVDPLPPFASGQANPRSIAIDGRNVYWANFDDGSVRACPLAGCEGAPRDIALNQDAPLGLAADGGSLYWANSSAGTVMRCAVDGCGLAPTEIARGLDQPVALAIDARDVYVVARNRTTILRFVK